MAAKATPAEGRACVRTSVGAAYEGRDPDLLDRILSHADYIEVTLETIAELIDDKLVLNPDIMSELKDVSRSAKIVVHGVSLSIASHDGWSSTYLHLLDSFLEQVDVSWHSEHLAYTRVDGKHLGIMLAVPKTEEMLDVVCERVRAI